MGTVTLPVGWAASLRMPCTQITQCGQKCVSVNGHSACRTSWEPEDAPTSPYALDTDLPMQTAARGHAQEILYFLLDIRGVDVVRLMCDCLIMSGRHLQILCLSSLRLRSGKVRALPCCHLHPIDP